MVLICLGETDEARKQLKTAQQEFPDIRTIQVIAEDFGEFADGFEEFRVKD